MNRAASLNTVQATCGHLFKNTKLLEEALTHDSHRVNNAVMPTYQRLEFLGDSVLNLVITEYLFKKHPDYTEGQLTTTRIELTRAQKQTEIAREMNLGEHVSFGLSVRKENFSRLHSFVESLIGAVYIDAGFEAARKTIYRLWKLDEPPAATCVLS